MGKEDIGSKNKEQSFKIMRTTEGRHRLKQYAKTKSTYSRMQDLLRVQNGNLEQRPTGPFKHSQVNSREKSYIISHITLRDFFTIVFPYLGILGQVQACFRGYRNSPILVIALRYYGVDSGHGHALCSLSLVLVFRGVVYQQLIL